jgi:hypothetical protein
MIAALFYLQFQSWRNRLITRFKRLKQPKYLFGAIAGGIYVYFYFFRYLFQGVRANGNHPELPAISPESMLLLESFGALALFVILLLAWLVPHERAALTFTEAEVSFLFPAPVSRRTLIHFKLIRSQLRIFLSALLLTLFTRRFGGNAWIHAFGFWLILSTLDLHILGCSFTRTLLLDRGISNWSRRLLLLLLVGGLGAFVWVWAKRTLPPMNSADLRNFFNYAQQLLDAGPALYLLYPFRLLVRPFFAPDGAAFVTALAPALLIFLLHYCWVIFADVAFEEASIEASQKLATKVAAMRSGNWQAAGKKPQAKREWFKLAPLGRAPVALLWKNLIGIGQIFSARLGIIFLIMLVAFFVGFGGSAHAKNFSVIAGIITAALLGYSTLLGPQLMRLDFRQDLPLADLLKTYPLTGWQIALGEILAPVAVLACFQWLLLLLGMALIVFLPGKHAGLMLAIGLSAAILLPVLDFLLLLIPNAAVLLFPSWVQTGKDSPRGVEAIGQRLIFAVGQLLVLVVALVPSTLAFVGVYFLLRLALGPIVPIPLATLAACLILAVECGFGVMLLGRWFERFDVTEETAR